MKIKAKKIGINGEGIGYFKNKPVFVPGLYLNEVAEVKIIKQHPKYFEAQIVKKIQTNSCNKHEYCLNQRCEGCSFKSLDYDQQLRCKTQLLKDALHKYNGKLDYKLKKIRASEQVTHYRNSLKLPFYNHQDQLKVGMYLNNSNYPINIDDCVVHDSLLETIKKQVVAILNQEGYQAYTNQNKQGLRYLVIRQLSGQVQVSIISAKVVLKESIIQKIKALNAVQSLIQVENTSKQIHQLFKGTSKVLFGDGYLDFNFNNLQLKIQPASFFQLNTKQALNMYEYVASLVNGADLVVEGYCGIGLMSMFISPQIKSGIGIEIVDSAIKDAKMNAQNNGINNLEFICGDFYQTLKQIDTQKDIDYLIIDPPRTGLDDQAIKLINQLNIKKIIYISCNPSTLSKNIQQLNQQYNLKHVKPFDMFPLTAHVESVCLLEKR